MHTYQSVTANYIISSQVHSSVELYICDLSQGKRRKAAKIDFRVFGFISNFQVVISNRRFQKIKSNSLRPQLGCKVPEK